MCITDLKWAIKAVDRVLQCGSDYSLKIRNDEIRFEEFRNYCLVFAVRFELVFVPLSSKTTNFALLF